MGTLLAVEGNDYKWVKIGNQIWMAENSRNFHYNNGMPVIQASETIWYGEL
ncbi:MAG: hypothetical protein ACI93L_001094 [Cyclobacteriaceae bacterium]|jgi:uncharacterized protein (TIGR02145 family)